MPVDRRHAFASAAVYGRPSAIARLLRTEQTRVWSSFERSATIGEGLRLGPSAWCFNDGPRDRIRIGARVVCRGIVRRESFGDGLLEIEDDVYVGDDCIVSCSAHVQIGAGTLLGHAVQIFDNNSHPVDAVDRAADWSAIRLGGPRRPIESAPVLVGERVWIGFGAILLKGTTIGDEAVVGAGAVVTRDVPRGVMVAGNPAVQVG